MPILRAAGLLVLKTIGGGGEMGGDSDGQGEVEEDEEPRRGSLTELDDLVCALSGDEDRGVGGSEEVKDEREGMLDVELWDGVGVLRKGEEPDKEDWGERS